MRLAAGVDDLGGGDPAHGPGYQRHVVTGERTEIGLVEERSLPGKGLARGDRVTEVRAFGQLGVDEAPADVLEVGVDLGAGPVDGAPEVGHLEPGVEPDPLAPA